MRSLYIIGAGGAAKEIFLLLKEINEHKPTFNFKGFVDVSLRDSLQIGAIKYPVINEVVFLKNHQEVSIVFGLADIDRLRKIIDLYRYKENFEFPSLVHPSVKLDSSVSLGKGNIIAVQCVFTVDITIGAFNYINRGVHIGHDCVINDYNVINPMAVISGGVFLGDENLVGTNATILQYLKIGSKNKIGAGAVVIKEIGNDSCLIGVPAKNIER